MKKKTAFSFSSLVKRAGISTVSLAIWLVFSLSLSSTASAQFVDTQGTDIVDANGNRIYFKGMNLGNWLLWEGYLMMGDFEWRTHTDFLNSLAEAFGSIDRAREFEHQWRLNYVTEQSIIDLKNLGYNSVRVPFHYNMFWRNGGVSNHGFQYIDRLIEYCKRHSIYVLLDMHAAPGGQNPGDHSDNNNSDGSKPRNSVGFWDGNNVNIAAQIWRHIANYYKNETIIWGYDLINEPVLPTDARHYELLPSLITMRNAIREVNNNHIIVAEGAWWASNLHVIDWTNDDTRNATGVTSQWDDKLVYQTHHYPFGNAEWLAFLYERDDITNRMGIPLILGEYGEDTNEFIQIMTQWSADNIAGAFPWSFKKLTHDRTLWTISSNATFDRVRNFIKNGGNPPTDTYNDMISFAQNNIKNGRNDLQFHQGFYNATQASASCSINTPSNLRGRARSNRIVLRWNDESNNENSFDIYRNGNVVATVGKDQTRFPDRGLRSNTCYDYRVAAVGACTAISAEKRFCTTCSGGSQSPYLGSPAAVPGTIEAENYDLGCYAYNDNTAGNSGGAYRSDDVDIGTTGDSSGYMVGWVDEDEWMMYTVNVDKAGRYALELRVASPHDSGKIQLRRNGQVLAEKSIAPTGGWDAFVSVQAGEVALSEGQQQLEIYFSVSLVNLNWFKLSFVPGSSPGTVGGEIATGTYTIKADHSGKLLNIAGASVDNGANIIQWRYSGTQNEVWDVTKLSDGSYKIISKLSGKSLDVRDASTNDGARIQQWEYFGSPQQRWIIKEESSGSYSVKSVLSGKALDVVDNFTSDGAEIQQWSFSGGNNQLWTFTQR